MILGPKPTQTGPVSIQVRDEKYGINFVHMFAQWFRFERGSDLNRFLREIINHSQVRLEHPNLAQITNYSVDENSDSLQSSTGVILYNLTSG